MTREVNASLFLYQNRGDYMEIRARPERSYFLQENRKERQKNERFSLTNLYHCTSGITGVYCVAS